MGTSGSKFRRALLSSDEETALKYYNDKVLRKHINVNDWLFNGRNSPLHLAAGFAMSTLLKRFLENGGNPNTKNAKHENIFHACVKPVLPYKRKKVQSQIIRPEEGEDAAREACLNVIFDMAARGALSSMIPLEINILDEEKNTPLHYAAGNGYIRCVKALVDNGAKLFLENKNKKTACDMSEDGGYVGIATYLESKMVFCVEEEGDEINEDYDFDKAELYSGMRCQDVQMQKDQLIVETADMLKVPLFTAEALLKLHDWNRKKLLDEWMADKTGLCDKAGVPVPPEDSTSVDGISVAVQCDDMVCEICVIEFEQDLRLSISCKHVFCPDCWTMYLTQHIMESPGETLECPGFECTKLVPTEIIEAVVSKDLTQRYLQFGIRSFVDTHPDMKWCPFPGCGRAVQLPDNPDLTFNYNGFILKTKRTKPAPRAVDCGIGHFFCWNCQDEAHEPCDCDLWDMWQKEIQFMKPEPKDMELAEHRANTVANSLWLITYSKPCPKCKSPIEKTEGCNHMKCWKCKHEFCWVCMEAWKIHSSETGGYFRCNRYQAVDKFNTGLAEVKKGIIEEHKKASKFQRFMHYYTRYHNHEMSHRLEEPLLSTAKMKMIALASECQVPASPQPSSADQDSDPSGTDTSFIENGVKELLKARRVLKASYPYGYYLQDGMHRKMLFEAMQNELEEVTENLSQMVARVYLRTPKTRIIETAQLLQQNRLRFVNAVANGLIPSSPPLREKMKNKRTGPKKPRDPFFDDDSDQDTEDAFIRLAIAESLLENAKKIPDQDEAVAFAPYARCVRYGCPLPRAKEGEGQTLLYCSEYCMQMDQVTSTGAMEGSAALTSNMALALQLNHEENLALKGDKHSTAQQALDSTSRQPHSSRFTTSSNSNIEPEKLDSVSQVLDTISDKAICDKTSKCNLYIGDSPLPGRSDSISITSSNPGRSNQLDNISALSDNVWERGSLAAVEVRSLSEVSSMCNLICMESGQSGIMSRCASPSYKSKSDKVSKKSSVGSHVFVLDVDKKGYEDASLRLFALVLDDKKIKRRTEVVRSRSLPFLHIL